MTQEDKELLLKDLSARLPYGVKFLRESWNYEWDQELSVIEVLEDIDKDGYINNTKVYNVEDIKPYLRPMSSMTEDERKYIVDRCAFTTMGPIGGNFGLVMPVIAAEWLTDFYNSHYLDWRGLIQMGLALEAKEGMYK